MFSMWHWYHYVALGFALGVGASCAVLLALRWIGRQPYMPGPFARPDLEQHYRLMPPRDATP